MTIPGVVFDVSDPNRWLVPPVNHELVGLSAEGQYLKVSYRGETEDGNESRVDVFLNDHGREVLRSVSIAPPATQQDWGRTVTQPLSRWEKFLLYIEVHVLGRF